MGCHDNTHHMSCVKPELTYANDLNNVILGYIKCWNANIHISIWEQGHYHYIMLSLRLDNNSDQIPSL